MIFVPIRNRSAVSWRITCANIPFTIVEGPQDKVASLNIMGNHQVTTKDLPLNHTLALGPGRSYSLRSLENDRNQILAGYLNRGFLNAGMDTKVEPSADDPHKMNVTYTIREGPQVDVASLVYLGNDRTRTKFLQKIMSKNVTQGNALSEGRLLTSESDLYNLGIFDWTSVRTRRPVNCSVSDLLASGVLPKTRTPLVSLSSRCKIASDAQRGSRCFSQS